MKRKKEKENWVKIDSIENGDLQVKMGDNVDNSTRNNKLARQKVTKYYVFQFLFIFSFFF